MDQRSKIVHALFVAIGIVLVLVAYIFYGKGNSHLPSQVAQNLGVVILSVTLVHFLWRTTGGEPIERQLSELKALATLSASAANIGLAHVYPRATTIASAEWLELIRSSRDHIDMSSHTMSQLLDEPHLWQALIEKARAGVKVRLLMTARDNPALESSGSSTEEYLESRKSLMRTAWEQFEEARRGLPVSKRNNLKVRRLTNESMFISVRRFDERIYVAQYLYTDNMRNNPVFMIKGARTALFAKYIAEFEGQFNGAEAPGREASVTTPPETLGNGNNVVP